MVPISDTLGRTTRIEDGYILTEGSMIKEVGKFDPKHIDEILTKFESDIEVIGTKDKRIARSEDVPQINGVGCTSN
jgi:hypothetical protein